MTQSLPRPNTFPNGAYPVKCVSSELLQACFLFGKVCLVYLSRCVVQTNPPILSASFIYKWERRSLPVLANINILFNHLYYNQTRNWQGLFNPSKFCLRRKIVRIYQLFLKTDQNKFRHQTAIELFFCQR